MKLALFFTRGVSVKTWLDTGLLEREKLIYEKHLEQGHFSEIYWLTYGSFDKELAEELQKEGKLHPEIRVVPMPTLFKGRRGSLIYSFLMPFVQRACLKDSDVYKTNQMYGSWSAVIAKWLYKKPLLVRTGYTLSLFSRKLKYSKWKIFFYDRIEKLSFRNADYAAVTTKKDEEYVLETYKWISKKLTVIPNYIDTKRFKPQEVKKCVDRIIFVGRLTQQKNLFNLISAIAKSEFVLDIYGMGPLEEKLRNHANKEKARVNFMGTAPNNALPEIYNRYEYYILPSYFEGMPKTLLEAMACGLVVIGANVEGIRDIIQHEKTGLLCAPTFEGIATTLKQLPLDASLRKRIGQEARKFVEMECSLDIAVKQEMEIFKKIL